MRGLAILLGFNFIGYLLHHMYVPLPGNVIGLILLVIALFAGWIKLSWIEETAQFLLKNMMVFFTPIVVGVIVIFPEYKGELFQILLGVIGGTLAVLLVTGWTVQHLGKARRDEGKDGGVT